MVTSYSQFSELVMNIEIAEPNYWSHIWLLIDSLRIYGTGDNWFFHLITDEEVELEDYEFLKPRKLYPETDVSDIFEDDWHFAFAAFERMIDAGDGYEIFGAVLRAARVEIVKSQLYCIACMCLKERKGNSHPQRSEDFQKWLEQIGDMRFQYADDAYYIRLGEPFREPGLGRHGWLERWIEFRQNFTPALIPAFYFEYESDDLPPNTKHIEISPVQVLAGAAFTWFDYSFADSEQHSAGLKAAAAMALRAANGFEGQSRKGRRSDDFIGWGRIGGLERHKDTRRLKEWALREAQSMRGADRQIARELSTRIPPDLSDASLDPMRLIYECLLSRTKKQRQASN